MGIIAAWLLQVKEGEENKFVTFIKEFRLKKVGLVRYLIIALMFVVVYYVSQNTTSNSWPTLTAIFVKGFYV